MWKINPNWARGLRHRWAAKLNVTPAGSEIVGWPWTNCAACCLKPMRKAELSRMRVLGDGIFSLPNSAHHKINMIKKSFMKIFL